MEPHADSGGTPLRPRRRRADCWRGHQRGPEALAPACLIPPPFSIEPQPDDATCGPTCLHAVYQHHGLELPLEEVIRTCRQLEQGGTLAVLLGQDALRRGFRATIWTWHLTVFDPSWFEGGPDRVREGLEAQSASVKPEVVRRYSREYLRFLELGGRLELADLTPALLRRHLKQGNPIITGLSATYLYRTAREVVNEQGRLEFHDVEGSPQGHFVVLVAYDPEERRALVADPLQPNPVAASARYEVSLDRLVNAILLGSVTHDANILVVQPARRAR